jgi:hypothetical protein
MTKPLPTFDQAMDSVKFRFLQIMQTFPDPPSGEVTMLALKFATYRTAIGIITDQGTIEKACILEGILYEMCIRNIQPH